MTRSFPTRLGRYRVIAPLAEGGMAEIFLASLEGGGSFARPVVIKRVLPHLARRKDLRAMFVDEARIVLGLRHPNVVSVFEFGQDDGELYLVMEYLEGESADALCRRTHKAGSPLSPLVACHIVAEAALGLHAAHELTDETGKHLAIIHRDVSPHNIFVGYEGAVKVIDFGVARAENRESKTETGTVKGKFAYMSPEQIEGRDVDRRTDVWALGICLYELLTGTRIFSRGNQAETVHAVTGNGPITPPSALRPEIHPAIDKITLNALERDVRYRYQNAGDMRRDLVRVIRALYPEGVPQEETAEIMQRVFTDRVARKRAMLGKLASGVRLASVPAADPDEPDEVSALKSSNQAQPATPASPSAGEASRAQTTFGGRPGAPFSAPMAAVAVAVLLVGVGMVAAFGMGGGDEGADEAPSAPARPPVAAAPEVVEPTHSVPSSPPPTSPPPAEPRTVHVAVTSIPPGADLSVDGIVVGTTPVLVEVPRSTELATLRVSLDGYEPVEETLALDGDFVRTVELERHRGRGSRRGGSEPAGSGGSGTATATATGGGAPTTSGSTSSGSGSGGSGTSGTTGSGRGFFRVE